MNHYKQPSEIPPGFACLELRLMMVCLLAGAVLMAASPLQASPSKTWDFKVYLGKKEIGQHSFQLTEQEDGTHVDIKADFDVYFLFIRAYRYDHSNHEVWNGNCLQSIKSTTDDNGDKFYVQADSTGDGFEVNSKTGAHIAEGCIRSFAYWSPHLLNNTNLLNSQSGELMSVDTEKLGRETISVRGEPVTATRYRLNTAQFSVDLWYSIDNEWLALHSTTTDGTTLRYQIQ